MQPDFGKQTELSHLVFQEMPIENIETTGYVSYIIIFHVCFLSYSHADLVVYLLYTIQVWPP